LRQKRIDRSIVEGPLAEIGIQIMNPNGLFEKKSDHVGIV
jgi:hypothetical protein